MTKYNCWIIAVLMVCVGAARIAAAGDWSIVRQADWSTHFRDITYADAQHAWAVGDSGVIAATSDGGKSWTPQRSGVTQNLQRVVFVDAKTGWAAGDGGTILHTADGGNTWQRQEIGSTADITAVYFEKSKGPPIGWAVGNVPTLTGSSGTIYRTEDGGATWKAQKTIETALYDIYFDIPSRGWAVGGQQRSVHGPGRAAILLTKDSGLTWTSQQVDLQSPLFSIYFGDNNTGWTFGIGAIWETGDGGKAWVSMLPPPDEEAEAGPGGFRRRTAAGLRRGTFAGESQLWGIDLMGRLVRMADDGKSITPIAVPARRLTDIAFVSPDAGCAVGEYGAILTTDDGGQSWTPRAKIKADILRSIAPASEENIWCVGSDGVVYQSDDSGQTWSQVEVGVRADFQAVSFADASNGWILARIAAPSGRRGGGPGRRGGRQVTGVILKTWDGGKTWSEQARGTEYPVTSISIVDPQNAYVSGSGGGAFGTKDGGSQWTQQNTGVAWDIADVFFVDVANGWAVCWSGLAIRTNDGGASWTSLNTYTAYDLNSVWFVTDKKGWAVGNYGIILTTDDGGDTWYSQRCYSYANLNSVYFADASRGWIVGDSGSIFVTNDGGKTWNAVSLPTKANLYDIKKSPDGSLWVAGEWGTIIRGAID